MESVVLCQKSKIHNVPYLLTVALVKTNWQACHGKPGICWEPWGQGHEADRNSKTSCPVSLESRRQRAATTQLCKPRLSLLRWGRRNCGRAHLRPSIAIRLGSMKSLQNEFTMAAQILEFNRIRTLLLRQGGAFLCFQNFSSAKRKYFYHRRAPHESAREKTHPTNSPLCGSSPSSNILLKMKLTFLLTLLKFPSQADSRVTLTLILILKSVQKRGNFLIINGRKNLFSTSKWKV